MNITVKSMPSPPVAHTLVSERAPKTLKTDQNYYWLFTEDWPWSIVIDGKECQFVVKKGYESDGGSIPRVAGFERGIAFRGYFIHDDNYDKQRFDRETCDKILSACLRFEGVDDADIDIIYAAVRIFGGSHYDDD